jgi:hypothetical protein
LVPNRFTWNNTSKSSVVWWISTRQDSEIGAAMGCYTKQPTNISIAALKTASCESHYAVLQCFECQKWQKKLLKCTVVQHSGPFLKACVCSVSVVMVEFRCAAPNLSRIHIHHAVLIPQLV